MAFSATFSHNPFPHLSPLPQPARKSLNFLLHLPSVRTIKAAAEPEKGKVAQAKPEGGSTNAQPATIKPPKKPVYSMKKGQIVRVDKEKYLNSINLLVCGETFQIILKLLNFDTKYLSVGHPPYYKGLDYIYEDRGEVLDLRIFETGEYALVAWVGIPTAPAWLPTDMLIKVRTMELTTAKKYYSSLPTRARFVLRSLFSRRKT
ncbi:hypothetical protein CRG98_037359 [Punica granatum]|uniref:NAD(P)H-quinone oxidoreductase subunit O, chloroplastic n=1 Tax=Punica granatum TaxID=22663 RepID=A0A2I0IEM2_PUNGR|nr:hypothetical protein CRG98_037359 [Punica granatum]